jgi:N-methylhydantoinase B
LGKLRLFATGRTCPRLRFTWLDGNSNIYANVASQSIEVTETEQPIEIAAHEFIPDAMGPGKFRGGAPFRRDYRLLAEEGILQVRSDHRDFRSYGLYGGGPGKPSRNYLNPHTENGDTFRHEVAGAGGRDDPLERDPAMVLRDVRNELVSSPLRARITAWSWPGNR